MASGLVPPALESEGEREEDTGVQEEAMPAEPTEYSSSHYSQGSPEQQAAVMSDQVVSTGQVTSTPVQITPGPSQAASAPSQVASTSTSDQAASTEAPDQAASTGGHVTFASAQATTSPVQDASTPDPAASTPVQAASAPAQDPSTPGPATESTPVQGATPPSDPDLTPPISNRTRSTTPEHTEKTQEEAEADVATKRAVAVQVNAECVETRTRAGNADTAFAQSNTHLQNLQVLTVTYRDDANQEPDANPEANPALITARAKVTQQETVVRNNLAAAETARSELRTAELTAAHADMHLAKAEQTAALIRRNMASAHYDRLLASHVDPATTHATLHDELKARERAIGDHGDQPRPQNRRQSGKEKAPVSRASRFFKSLKSLVSPRKRKNEAEGDDQPQPGGDNQSSPRTSARPEQGRTKRQVRELTGALF